MCRIVFLRPRFSSVPGSGKGASFFMTDIRTLLHRTTREFTAGGSPSPRLDAEVLLMHFLKTDRLQLCMHPETELSEEACAGFSLWIERRRRGEPVAYITGQKEFWSLLFEVNRDVLIPRPETECLVEEVLKCYSREAGHPRIIDIGTGSGAIAVVLASEIPSARMAATDISRGALDVARRNAERHGAAGRIEFLEGDLFASAVGEFDVIVSNPPYIPDDVYSLLPEGIQAFEPREALIAGPDGAGFHRKIIREGASRLKPGGRIFLEIGEGQQGLVDSLFRDEGCYTDVCFRKDYGGMDRVASARKKSEG
jgi:release factor glutamine methyltransferase